MSLKFDFTIPRRDFDLALSGEFKKGITGIFGSSGAGKTTFFNVVSGIEKPQNGFVCLNKRLLTDMEKKVYVPIHKRSVGVVFQDNLLFPHLSIKDNLLFGMPYVTNPRVKFNEIVDLLDLSKVLDSKPSEVSGGEGQRTAIGRAILTSPQLLLLDEPFNAVDYELRSNILHYIKSLKDFLDIPILVISHDYMDLKKLTNDFYMIDRGKNGCIKKDVC